MHVFFVRAVAVAALSIISAPAVGQQKQPSAEVLASAEAATPTAEQRLATVEAELARQTRIADNARQSMEAMRAEMALKDELLVLGRERNAELYAIAMEIAKVRIRSDDWEPFFQGERVKMENLRQSYEDRLRAARIVESTLPPSVQRRMDAEIGKQPADAAKTAPQN